MNRGFTGFAVRGRLEERKFSLFYFRDETLIAVDSINRPQDHMVARKLLANRARISPQEAGDPAFDLKVLANRSEAVAPGTA
jgi:3-phenylpropionate/trans-cinnamate dioxygenase ferredoxin reductase subunit